VSGVVRALSIAGSDPSGGAGIQADLKTFSALGAYGMAAITSLTAQNTQGVTAVHTPSAAFLTAQLEALAADVTIDAVKIGMVADADVARAIAAWLRAHRPPVVVLDPVMVATSGDRLLAESAVDVVRDELVPCADLVTPNLPELAVLVGGARVTARATTWDEALAQGRTLADLAGVAVLVKGGHLGGERSPDALIDPGTGPGATGTTTELPGERVPTRHTHGTGCSLSSALAVLRPVSADWAAAARAAKAWLTGALRAADVLAVGSGHGPVHHFHALWPVPKVDTGTVNTETLGGQPWLAPADRQAAGDDLPFVRGLTEGDAVWRREHRPI
jgi:hydroxymethylpyrimidine/phosphomethylpyrimidine kinase